MNVENTQTETNTSDTIDHQEEFTTPALEEGLGSRFIWTVVFIILFWFVRYAVFLVGFVQMVFLVVNKNRPNKHLAEFGDTLGKWTLNASHYISAKTETKPWPLSKSPK